MKFRKDINFLRCLAVSLVVIFHFDPSLVPGGYIGVDVFFVISGYLMTSIISGRLENGNFSLSDFYWSRSKRIIPALLAVCFFVLVFNYFFLSGYKFRELGKHVIASMAFLSNIIYMLESGYFDTNSHFKWLLHTWSLSIEWQFYMIYPLVLLLMYKIKDRVSVAFLLLVLSVFSFFNSVYFANSNPVSSFFMLHTRAWELVCGGLVYFYMDRIRKFDLSAFHLEKIGVLLIIISAFYFDGSDKWPYFYAIFPVLGVVFVLMAESKKNILFNIGFFQFIGLVSYSVYLWHWPIVVASSYLDLDGVYFTVIGVFMSLAFGWISYIVFERMFVNNNIKLGFNVFLDNKVIMFGLGYISIFLLSGLVYLNNGYSDRLPESLSTIEKKPRGLKCGHHIVNGCQDGVGNSAWAVLGNSHAAEIAYELKNKLNGISSVDHYIFHGCYLGGTDEKCNELNDNAVKDIVNDKGIENVVISYRMATALYGDQIEVYPDYSVELDNIKNNENEQILDRYFSVVDKIERSGKNVYLVFPFPELAEDINSIVYKEVFYSRLADDLKGESLEYYYKRNAAIRNKFKENGFKGRIIDPKSFFCDEVYCFAIRNNKSLYFDDDHPSLYAASKIVDEIFKVSGVVIK